MKVTTLPANCMCTKKEWRLSIVAGITHTSSGTKALSRRRPSPYSSFQQVTRNGLTLQTRETVISEN